MQVFLQIVAFSLQTDGSGRPVLTKGKRPKMKLSAKFKQILWSGFRATSKFSSCEGCYESAAENLFKHCREFYVSVLIALQQYTMGVTEFVFEI